MLGAIKRVMNRAPNSMVATAILQHYAGTAIKTSIPGVQAWQTAAWQYYDQCGELRAGVNWKANAMSRARLIVARAKDTDADPQPIASDTTNPDERRALDILAGFGGGPIGQSRILRMTGLQMEVCGDSYTVGWEMDGEEHWEVRSPEEIRQESSGNIAIQYQGSELILPSDSGIAVRNWNRHPNRSWQSDSSTRGVLVPLAEAEQFGYLLDAEIKSRLINGGLLLVPQEMNFPRPPGSMKQPSVNTLLDVIVAAAKKGIEDPNDPGRLVPICISGPGEQLKNVQLIQFWSGLSEKVDEYRRNAWNRVAVGLDVPSEVITGMGQVNHWGAWQIERAGITLHVEPTLAQFCGSITRALLRPLVADEELIFWYDISELLQPADRGPAASDVFDRGELSGAALRRYHSFSDDDAPDDTERKRRLEYQIAVQVAQAIPGVGEKVLSDLGITAAPGAVLVDSTRVPVGKPVPLFSEPVRDTQSAPALPPAAQQSASDTPGSSSPPPALVAAAAVLATHAFSYAGKKWRKGQPRSAHQISIPVEQFHRVVPVPDDHADFLLDGVWSAFENPRIPQVLLSAVQGHVRKCLIAGAAHDVDELMASLAGVDA